MYLFFDTETTGLPKNSELHYNVTDNWPRLVSIAWILCDDNRKIVEIEKHIVRPNGWIIPSDASKVHGITTERALAEGISIQDVLFKFLKALGQANYVAGHNIRFDRNVVAAELFRYADKRFDVYLYEKPYRDTMHIAREFVAIPNKGKSGYKFPTLGEMYAKLCGKEMEDAHDAAADIKATIVCFWKLFDLGLVDKFYKTHKDRSDVTKF